MTFFYRQEATFSYFDPDGTIRTLESYKVRNGTWWVDETGTQLLKKWPNASAVPVPIATYGKGLEARRGDIAGVKLKSDGISLLEFSAESVEQLAERARAR
jgi:hypothetical protein